MRELTQAEPINLTAGSVTGEVRDSISGQPLVGVELTLRPLGVDTTQQAPIRAFTFAPAGAYRFGSVPAGSYRLRAEFAGYQPRTVDVQNVVIGERRVLTLRLPRR